MKRIWAPWRMSYIKKNNATKCDCIFCEKPTQADDAANYILKRGKTCFVLLNIYPYNNGHLMVTPYRHIASLTDLTNQEQYELMELTSEMTAVLTKAMAPQGFNVGLNLGAAAGAGIADHLHMHVVPRWNGDTNFMPAIGKVKIMPQSLDETYACLREFITPISGE